MSSEENDLVRRLQAKADGLRKEPLPLLLGNDFGPYQLPLCIRASVYIEDSGMAQLILDTKDDQQILIPLSVELLRSLGGAISTSLTPRQNDPK